MKKFQSILVVVPPHILPATLKQLIFNSLTLGQWLASEVHILSEASEEPGVGAAILEFEQRLGLMPPVLILNRAPPEQDTQADRVKKLTEKERYGLLVMIEGALLDEKRGADEREILEQSGKPVLVFPEEFDFGKERAHSFIVPLSGETSENEALSVSLQIADLAQSIVDLLHVAASDSFKRTPDDLDSLGDQMHHEFSEMSERIVSEASPFSTVEERSRVRRMCHCTGSIVTEITKLIHDSPGAILSLQWKGTFAEGRAETIKDILQKAHCPILFVKASHGEKSTLRVGRNFRAA